MNRTRKTIAAVGAAAAVTAAVALPVTSAFAGHENTVAKASLNGKKEVDDKVTTLVTHFVPEPESDDDSASNAGKPDAGGDAGGEGGGQFITPEAEAIFAVAEELHFLKDHISPGGVSASKTWARSK